VAATLDRLLGGGGQVFFANSGAEANECALKLARKLRRPRPSRGGQRVRVVPRPHARHAARHRPAGRSTRRSSRCPRASATWRGTTSTRSRRRSTRPVAAVLLEPVQGEGGVNPATAEYFAGVRRLCDERGVLFMVDEVQTGLGQMRAWFAHQHLGVVPDVVTMAKALGNGMPIGACWAKAEVAAGVRARRPRHHLRRPAAGHRRRPGRAGRDGGRGRARPGDRGPGRASPRSCWPLPQVAEVRGLGLLLAARAGRRPRRPGGGGRPRPRPRVRRQRRHPTALRLAPSLFVTDAEIDPGGARSSPPPLTPGGDQPDRPVTRHLLEIDDLTADRAAQVLDRCVAAHPPRCWPAGGGAHLREAVEPHPQLHRDGGGGSSAATRCT
jgi:acetylornithine/N-succinyldiaminopimelate aminotransferase